MRAIAIAGFLTLLIWISILATPADAFTYTIETFEIDDSRGPGCGGSVVFGGVSNLTAKDGSVMRIKEGIACGIPALHNIEVNFTSSLMRVRNGQGSVHWACTWTGITSAFWYVVDEMGQWRSLGAGLDTCDGTERSGVITIDDIWDRHLHLHLETFLDASPNGFVNIDLLNIIFVTEDEMNVAAAFNAFWAIVFVAILAVFVAFAWILRKKRTPGGM